MARPRAQGKMGHFSTFQEVVSLPCENVYFFDIIILSSLIVFRLYLRMLFCCPAHLSFAKFRHHKTAKAAAGNASPQRQLLFYFNIQLVVNYPSSMQKC